MKYKIKYEDKIYEYESLKIAIVKLSAMGDIIHAMVVLQFLKKFDPTIQIDWIVESAFAPILENNPHITNIYKVNLKKAKKNPFKLIKEILYLKTIKKKRYDLVIDAQGLLKSAIVTSLIGDFTAGFDKNSIREKIASLFYNEKVSIAYDENTIDRNVKVITKPLGIEVSTKEIMDKEPFLYFSEDEDYVSKYIKQDKKNIIFVIGSTWESRNYPKEKFLEIVNALKENVIVVWENEDEYSKAKWLENNSEFITCVDKLSLDSLKNLISKCDLLIGNDTGPTHMAWGLNRPSITIFGPTPINRVYITPINKVVKSPSTINHFKLDKNDFSISQIDSSEIIVLAKELLYG